MSLAYPRGRVSPAFFIPVSCTYLFFFVIVHSEKKSTANNNNKTNPHTVVIMIEQMLTYCHLSVKYNHNDGYRYWMHEIRC